ncbi:MAG: Trk system potassium transporter TrkA [Acidimicrobiaceae bacterium]|nr:Trk system potassium transporter TrkA [Acidimicrobiaceae bacterium]|tara:strand:+ start:5970 stop:7361 length:1392 start_codon:yes stop_codon:yes gene_type:complete
MFSAPNSGGTVDIVRILVVGAGEVGSYVAARLSREGNDVVVIDELRDPLTRLERDNDIFTIMGDATNPSTLIEAEVEKTEVLVAVTQSHKTNLLVCLQARQARGEEALSTIARIDDPELRGPAGRKIRDAMGVDLVLDPDEQTAGAIQELLLYRGASNLHEMAGGEVLLVGARLADDAPVVGRSIGEIGSSYDPEWDFIFGEIVRDGESHVIREETVLQSHDLLRVVCLRRGRRELMGLLGLHRTEVKRVMLLGGGRTAELLAKRLIDRGVEVAIIEVRKERCERLAENLPGCLVFEGDITDTDLLSSERVGDFDTVVASTGQDDANVLACLYAKSMGAPETIAVVHRLSLLPLLEQVGIDAALSPRTASANSVLRYVRGDVADVATFLDGDVEVVEFEVAPEAPADGAVVRDLGLSSKVLLAAIVRDGNAQIARGRSILRARDHVIVFAKPQLVDEVKQAFG